LGIAPEPPRWVFPLLATSCNKSVFSLIIPQREVVGVRRGKSTKTEDDNANTASNMYKRGSSGCFILPLEWSEV